MDNQQNISHLKKKPNFISTINTIMRRSTSQKVLRIPSEPICKEWVTFQKTSENSPHHYLLQLIEDRLEFKESVDKFKPKYSIMLRNIGSVNCVESTLIIKHLKQQKIEAHNWLMTYVMFSRRESARLFFRVIVEAMVTNRFPKTLNIKNKEEGDKEKKEDKLGINRSLSQGNYQINRVNKQTLSSSTGPNVNKSTNQHNSSTTNHRRSQRVPDRRSRSTCGSPDLKGELKVQNDKSDNTIPIRRNKEKLARPRAKTQNQTQQPQALTKSQKSAGSSSIVIIKKRPANNPPVTTPEAPQSNAELLSTLNFHNNYSPDPLNMPFPLSLHHSANPPQTNPSFIFDNVNPFKDISSNSLSKSQPPETASINPFLTPEVFITDISVPNNLPNTQIASYHNNNPFLQN